MRNYSKAIFYCYCLPITIYINIYTICLLLTLFLCNHLLLSHDYPSSSNFYHQGKTTITFIAYFTHILVQTINTRGKCQLHHPSQSQLEQGGALRHWSSSKVKIYFEIFKGSFPSLELLIRLRSIYWNLFLYFAETVILLDRCLFLLENGADSLMFPLFDPLLSPRNQVIVAVKKS